MGSALDTPWAGQQFAPPSALDIGTIENTIVSRLRAAVQSIEVVHFPDRPGAYRLTHRVGAALVVYRGAAYGELRDTGAIIQERRLQFDVTVLVRDLGWGLGSDPSGGAPGAYAILESIRAALTGYQVAGARKMYPVREEFLGRDRDGGAWTYRMTFALTTVALEVSRSDDLPLFVKGVALERGGQTTVTVGASAFAFDSNDEIQLPNGNVLALAVGSPASGAYAEGTDFTLEAAAGVIVRMTTGSIAAGATVNVAYTYAETAVAAAGQSVPSA